MRRIPLLSILALVVFVVLGSVPAATAQDGDPFLDRLREITGLADGDLEQLAGEIRASYEDASTLRAALTHVIANAEPPAAESGWTAVDPVAFAPALADDLLTEPAWARGASGVMMAGPPPVNGSDEAAALGGDGSALVFAPDTSGFFDVSPYQVVTYAASPQDITGCSGLFEFAMFESIAGTTPFPEMPGLVSPDVDQTRASSAVCVDGAITAFSVLGSDPGVQFGAFGLTAILPVIDFDTWTRMTGYVTVTENPQSTFSPTLTRATDPTDLGSWVWNQASGFPSFMVADVQTDPADFVDAYLVGGMFGFHDLPPAVVDAVLDRLDEALSGAPASETGDAETDDASDVVEAEGVTNTGVGDDETTTGSDDSVAGDEVVAEGGETEEAVTGPEFPLLPGEQPVQDIELNEPGSLDGGIFGWERVLIGTVVIFGAAFSYFLWVKRKQPETVLSTFDPAETDDPAAARDYVDTVVAAATRDGAVSHDGRIVVEPAHFLADDLDVEDIPPPLRAWVLQRRYASDGADEALARGSTDATGGISIARALAPGLADGASVVEVAELPAGTTIEVDPDSRVVRVVERETPPPEALDTIGVDHDVVIS